MTDVKDNSHGHVPELVKNAVLVHSSPLPTGTPTVKGFLVPRYSKNLSEICLFLYARRK